ncbi:MAG: porphyrinogen peroxidase [Thiomicrorhabdus sp.]|nr:MAG: porphyrinogen peroxidase [Thiomicrorhabdus sp.]
MSVKSPQAGIYKEGSKHFYFLEYHFKKSNLSEIKQVLSESLPTSDSTSVVVSFGKAAWQLLQPNWQPATLESFTTIKGLQGHEAPSTQADLFFWVHGVGISEVYDAAMSIHAHMQSVAELSLQERGFDYHNSQDLIGFEDGTANPKTVELRKAATVIPDGLSGAGGCLVLSQKWVHDLDKWHHTPVHCQEAIVGRTKVENIELEGDAMPDDSHVSSTDLTVDGVPMKIYRRSAPFGSMTEKGLLFLAFGCDLLRFSSQLETMYGLGDTQKIDQLINFSKAVTGSYWFAPSQEDLAEILS